MSSPLRSGPSRQPSMASTASAAAASSPAPAGATTTSSLSNPSHRFRKLIWDATIPVAITVEGSDLTALGTADRSIETYYVRAPRISYLPLLLRDVKANLLSIMLDDASLSSIKEEEFWFTYDGTPLRWHWPLGLLYDYHAVNAAPSIHRSAVSNVNALTNSMRRLSSAPTGKPTDGYFSSQNTDRGASPFVPSPAPLPWRIVLRIGHAPLDKLHSAPGLDNCRSSFMSMVKEADFVRHGSTKRVVNLRRTEQDALWEGVVEHDFDMYWSVASKIVPSGIQPTSSAAEASGPGSLSPSRAASIVSTAGEAQTADRYGTTTSQLTARPSLTQQFNESQTSLHSAAPSETNISVAESAATNRTSTAGGGGGASVGQNYRSLPMRFHLDGGAPVVQEPVAPFTEDGRAATLHSVLSALFPLLFPPTPTFSASSSPTPPPPLAYAVIQGIRVPLEAEIPWIGAVLPSADGW